MFETLTNVFENLSDLFETLPELLQTIPKVSETLPGSEIVTDVLKTLPDYIQILNFWETLLTYLRICLPIVETPSLRPYLTFLRPWERLKAGGEGDDRGCDGWLASPTQWT